MAAAGPSGGNDTAAMASKLYEECRNNYDPDQLFYQQDLLNMGVIPGNDLSLLLQCTQWLVDQKLFRLLHGKDDRLAWKVISQEDAEKLQNLSPDESLVYNVIHSTGRSGIWVRAIGTRTNLHKSILDRCLKSLESKNYIKPVRNVKFPKRKMYMLAGLAPSEDVTGGAFFTDGELDANFINALAGFIEVHVSRKSWYEVPADQQRPAKRQKTADGGVATGEAPKKEYLPYPPGYKGYPTVAQITEEINKTGLTPVHMGEESVAQLLEMLCYDNKLVALDGGRAYRSVRKPDVAKAEVGLRSAGGDAAVAEAAEKEGRDVSALGRNGMTEVPCGQCPVFKLCAQGGAVSPETCEYFDPWLEKALGF
ncbi:putative DNA-directed RNA polymerase III subunit Rpc34 [Thermoascus aurantiacus ATCC 26904]